MNRQQVMIVAGEVSGDIHAGNLLQELTAMRPAVHAFGVGGDELAAAGLECVHRTEELAHMGLIEVLKELPRLRGVMRHLVEEATARSPDVAVLVDSPDFNLRLARHLRRLAIPVILYVSPQLWAWRKGRVKTVSRVAREVLCILPFEVDFYRSHGVTSRYVGHPLVDDVARSGLLGGAHVVAQDRLGLLPGSRRMEVMSLLPAMLEGLSRLPPDIVRDAVLVEAPGVSGAIDEILARRTPDPRLRRVRGNGRRAELATCNFAWTASGTATLECALLDVPMVVGYRLQRLSFLLAKTLVRVPHVALVNLIAGQRVAPELIQDDWQPDALVRAAHGLLEGGGSTQRTALAKVRERLGPRGASRRAAEAVAETMDGARMSSRTT